ncbi:MAG: hypothetical protein AB7F65_06680 [Dehalococcoidia bacterium]
MPQDGGWIRLMEVPSRRMRARAHLRVNEMTSGGWRGRLDSVRLEPGATLASGNYIALFGPWTEPHVVQLAAGADGGAPSIVLDEAPSALAERSDGH